jgi:hypothetical protein
MVKDLGDWLKDFPDEPDCDIVTRVMITTPNKAKYFLTDKGLKDYPYPSNKE